MAIISKDACFAEKQGIFAAGGNPFEPLIADPETVSMNLSIIRSLLFHLGAPVSYQFCKEMPLCLPRNAPNASAEEPLPPGCLYHIEIPRHHKCIKSSFSTRNNHLHDK